MRKTISMLILLSAAVVAVRGQVELGEKVPNFSAIDQDGDTWDLKKHLKQSDFLVVYFYPAAFTGGCTAQACAYRDQKGDLEAVGAQVVGVSGDKPEILKLFAQEHGLNFTLLSDASGEIASLFDVPFKLGGGTHQEVQGKSMDIERGSTIQRWTFILDRKGNLIYKDTEVNAAQDSNKVVDFLSSL